jgi:hypothetical protein
MPSDPPRQRQSITQLPGITYLSWTRTVNATGSFKFQVTPAQFPRELFGVDRRVYIWRQVQGYRKHPAFMGLMQYRKSDSRGGNKLITIAGPDMIDILDTRIIAYAAGSAQSDKSDTADDVMKQYVRENLGASAARAHPLHLAGRAGRFGLWTGLPEESQPR